MTHVYRVAKSLGIGDLVDSEEALEAFARENRPSNQAIRHYEEVDLVAFFASSYEPLMKTQSSAGREPTDRMGYHIGL